MALANTAAMRAAKVGDDVKDVPGGEIVRDKDGRPTGVFKDNAMSIIDRVQPDPTMQQRAGCDGRRDGLLGGARSHGGASYGNVAAAWRYFALPSAAG